MPNNTPRHITKALLDNSPILQVGKYLSSTNRDFYVLYELIYHTGHLASTISKFTVAEMSEFCENNYSYMSQNLLMDIRAFLDGRDSEEYCFRSAKDKTKPISRRTYEFQLKHACSILNIEPFTIKTLNKTFYYEQLRENDYQYPIVKKILKQRNFHTMTTINEFLEYCNISYDEYKKDYAEHMKSKFSHYINMCTQIKYSLTQIEIDLKHKKTPQYKLEKDIALMDSYIAVYLNSFNS